MPPTKHIKTYFDRLAVGRDLHISEAPHERYEQRKRHEFVRSAFQLANPARVLDVGCGNGRDVIPLALSRSACSFVGVDLSGAMIDGAKAKLRAHPELQKRVTFLEGDFLSLPSPIDFARFDLVICSEVLEHVPEASAFIQGLASALRPGGLLALTVPNRWSLYGLNRQLVEGLNRRRGRTAWDHPCDLWKTPAEVGELLTSAGFRIERRRGICYLPGFTINTLLPQNGVRALIASVGATEPILSPLAPVFGYMYGVCARLL